MFGSTAKTPFGGGSTFGTGTTAFGAQATASPFGQTSGTGTAGGGGLFGATNTQTSGFGTFGPTQQAGTGLFGGTTNTSTGTSLFGGGGTTTGSLFGQSSGTKGFGTPGTSGSIFGGNPSSTGSTLFGQSSTFNAGATGSFGGTGSLFGTPSTSAGTATSGLFGGGTTQQSSLFNSGASGFQNTGFGSQAATAQAGTPLKFNVVSGTDQMVKNGLTTTVNTRHQSITVMKEYEAKSFEELRFEDYSLGRKTGSSGTTTGGLFPGSTLTTTSASTGGLFGGNSGNFSAFGQPKTGFGTTGGTGLFGQPAQTSTGGLFGSKPGGLFGTNTTSTATSGFGASGFGTPASGGLFGQTSSAGPTGGLFGTTTTTQSGGLFGTGTTGFGQPTSSASTGLFGQTGFGNTAQTGLFNNKLGTTSTGFGTATSGGLFGASNQLKPASTGFGGLGSTTGFGAGANNTSLFGKQGFGTTGTLGTGFGTGTTGTGLFGGTSTGLGTGLSLGLGGQTAFGTTGLSQPGSGLNLVSSSAFESSFKMLTCIGGGMECGRRLDIVYSQQDLMLHILYNVAKTGCTGDVAYAACMTYPDMKITVLDLPPVIQNAPHFRPSMKECPNQQNVTFVKEDFFEPSLPAADLYVLTHVLHDWGETKTDAFNTIKCLQEPFFRGRYSDRRAPSARRQIRSTDHSTAVSHDAGHLWWT